MKLIKLNNKNIIYPPTNGKKNVWLIWLGTEEPEIVNTITGSRLHQEAAVTPRNLAAQAGAISQPQTGQGAKHHRCKVNGYHSLDKI